jgi:hypothetical protein
MKLLVIRGDLQSHSGYSAAARDYSKQLQGLFDKTLGVDIHHSPLRPFEPFIFPLVDEAVAQAEAQSAEFALILSFTTPSHYTRYKRCANVGLTFWETDRLPSQGCDRSPWIDNANEMDALWLPSLHTKNVFMKAGVTVPMRVIPWPLEIPEQVGEGLPGGQLYRMDQNSLPLAGFATVGALQEDRFNWTRRLTSMTGPAAQKLFLQRLRTSSQKLARSLPDTFLCVAQHVPRKALLLFLSEWMEFKRYKEAGPWRLILKTSSIDPSKATFDLVSYFWHHLQALKKQLRVPRSEVYLWADDLTGPDFLKLVGNTYAVVAPSLGEGFCGPVALALGLGKPVAAPRHTAFNDYLAPGYRYSYDSHPAHVSFVEDPIPIYDPASVWNVPVPFAMSQTLLWLASDSAESRKRECLRASAHLRNWCQPVRVRSLLADEVKSLMTCPRRSIAA